MKLESKIRPYELKSKLSTQTHIMKYNDRYLSPELSILLFWDVLYVESDAPLS